MQAPSFPISNLLDNSTIKLISILFFTLILTGCNDDLEIRQYRIPKKSDAQKNAAGLSWTKPDAWLMGKSDNNRLASFWIPAKDTQLEVTIVVLDGNAGGTLANINRWRQQIKLPPIGVNEIRMLEKQDRGDLGSFSWYRLNNKNAGADSIVAAVLKNNQQTIFVKMKGPIGVLDTHSAEFLALCRSIRKGRK